MDGDLKALDAGTHARAPWTNIWRCGTKSRRRCWNISTHPLVFLSTSQAPSARRAQRRGVPLRRGVQRPVGRGCAGPGLDRFYEEHRVSAGTSRRNGSAVVCENFARTIPDLKLADTVNAQTHSLPPWGGEVSALADDLRPLHGTKVCRGSAGGHAGARPRPLARDLAAAGFSAQAYHKEPPSPCAGQRGCV